MLKLAVPVGTVFLTSGVCHQDLADLNINPASLLISCFDVEPVSSCHQPPTKWNIDQIRQNVWLKLDWHITEMVYSCGLLISMHEKLGKKPHHKPLRGSQRKRNFRHKKLSHYSFSISHRCCCCRLNVRKRFPKKITALPMPRYITSRAFSFRSHATFHCHFTSRHGKFK